MCRHADLNTRVVAITVTNMSEEISLDVVLPRKSGASTITQETYDQKHGPFYKFWRELTLAAKPRNWTPLDESPMNEVFMSFLDSLNGNEWCAYERLRNDDRLLFSITPSSDPKILEEWFLRTSVEREYTMEGIAVQIRDVCEEGKWKKLVEMAERFMEERKKRIEEEDKDRKKRTIAYLNAIRNLKD